MFGVMQELVTTKGTDDRLFKAPTHAALRYVTVT